MKNFIFALTILFSGIFSIQATAPPGNLNTRLQIRTLGSNEAQSQLKISTHWIEIKAIDNTENQVFHIVDAAGNIQKTGVLKNGKVLVDISDLRVGKYTLEVKNGETTDKQNLEIL